MLPTVSCAADDNSCLEIKKKLSILTNVLIRNQKDLKYYQEDEVKQALKISKMTAENADWHDIRKQKEVLEETQKMIPLSGDSIEKSFAALKQFFENNASLIKSCWAETKNASNAIQAYEKSLN